MVGSNSMVMAIAKIHCPIIIERKVRYWQHLLYIVDFHMVRGHATSQSSGLAHLHVGKFLSK
jgi:hypothetical protein